MKFTNSEEKSTFVNKLFSRIAPYYDFLNTIISFNRDKYWRKVAVSKLNLKDNDHILDVACGTGKLCFEILKQNKNVKITGLDFNKDMLMVAKKELISKNLMEKVELIQGDAMEMPFEDNTFSSAISAFALRNVPDVPTVLREMKRVVKNDGVVVNLEIAKPTMPIFKELFNFYFKTLMPRLAKLSGGDHSYLWLHDSWRQFYHQEKLKEEFIKAGFQKVDYQELTGGIVAVHYGVLKK